MGRPWETCSSAWSCAAARVAPDLAGPVGGHCETVFDLAVDQPVGYVYVDVNRELLSTESHGFLGTLFCITLIGGMLTAGVAIVLAAAMPGSTD